MKRLCLLFLIACGHDSTPRTVTPEAGMPDASSTVDAGRTDSGGVIASDPGFVACGPTSCSPGGIVAETCCVASSVYQCQELSQSCAGHRIGCDETGDCRGGQCCAERDGTNVVTSCRANCITGVPRWQVCKNDSECESGACRPYLCAPDLPPIRACAQPDGCTPQ